jgi:Uma2 family endonuclease
MVPLDDGRFPAGETTMVQQLTYPAATDELPRMTFEEYRAWAVAHPHSEWVEGEVIEFMSVKLRHGFVVGFLFELFRRYLRYLQLGVVAGDPVAILVRAGNGEPRLTRQPDLFVVLTEHLDRFRDEWLEGPADLAIEVVSDDSERRDRRIKLAEYAEVGVPEYWLVEGRAGRQGTELYVRNAAGEYERVLPDSDGRLHSTVLSGFWLTEEWLAADPLPDVDDVLEEIVPNLQSERAARLRQRRAATADRPS